MERGQEEEARALAEAVRQACVTAALAAYEQGGLAGLCEEGRWELAIDAIRALDVRAIVTQATDANAVTTRR